MWCSWTVWKIISTLTRSVNCSALPRWSLKIFTQINYQKTTNNVHHITTVDDAGVTEARLGTRMLQNGGNGKSSLHPQMAPRTTNSIVDWSTDCTPFTAQLSAKQLQTEIKPSNKEKRQKCDETKLIKPKTPPSFCLVYKQVEILQEEKN